jgi:hypothetical protein
LNSDAAVQSLLRDPYWPKWDSPWWHMQLLYEMVLVKQIPEKSMQAFVSVLKRHYLPVFPIHEKDVPAGTDPYRQIACHCAMGSAYQLIFNYGIDVDAELSWMRPWFLKYQLPDGGLNCDEKAYTKLTPKSSIVSSLPCFESILFCRSKPLTDDEEAFLSAAATYLLRQRIFRKQSTGEVIDRDWLEVRFPRFYEYDFLRGFYFLAKWREISGQSIPDDLTDEVEKLIQKQLTSNGLKLLRYNLFDRRSYNPSELNGWSWGDATEFELMKSVSFEGATCDVLTSHWNEVKPRAATVRERYDVAYSNPIKLQVGDKVLIEKLETNPEWLGWVFCRDQNGVGGWVSEKYLRASGNIAVVKQSYDASELACETGEKLISYYQEFGWAWCKNRIGSTGWVPCRSLEWSE